MNSDLTLFRSLRRLALGLALFAWNSADMFGQAQNPDCNNCPCTLPGILGYQMSGNPGVPAGTTQTFNNVPVANAAAGTYLRFYAWAGSGYLVSVCSETANTEMYLTNPTNGKVACDDDGCGTPNGPSIANFIATQTGLYRIYLFNGSCPTPFPMGTTVSVTITRTLPTPPANNLPCDAIPLAITGNDCNYLPATNLGATNSATVLGLSNAQLPIPGCLYQGGDVWYSAVIPASGMLAIEVEGSAMCAPAFAIFSSPADCAAGPFTQLTACYDQGITGPGSEPSTVYSGTPGTTVLIRVWERNGNENGTFEICAYEALPPPNDEPCGTILLDLNNACVPENYTFANASPLATTTAPAPSCGGANFTAYPGDMWFTFQVPPTLPGNWSGISVNTIAGSQDNLAMAWYRLTGNLCNTPYGSMTEIACNTNQTPGNLMPRLSMMALNAGETIYVRLWSENPYIGTFQICAVLNQTPVNDDPCGALPLNLNYGCVLQSASNESATQTYAGGVLPPGVASVPNPSCGAPVNGDVWYTVTVPPNGVVQFDTQNGSLTDAAMAVYRVNSGSCASNNLALIQVGCAAGGSAQGSTIMPALNITGQVPGSTLYVRVWRQAGTDGTFSICARRTDPPPGDCYYTLTLTDAAGDGWGGSFVTVCVGGNCSDYTVNGTSATINIGADIGDLLTVGYTAAGGFQNQNSYILSQFNSPVYISGSPPPQGTVVFSETVLCDPPPAPPSDCIGANQLCSQVAQVNQFPQNTGGVADLHPGNRGCISGNERQGLWYTFTISVAGTLGFTITPATGADYDFGVWGPYASGSNLFNICPPASPPIRCSWAAGSGPTGLAINAGLPTTEGAGGTGFVRHLTAQVGEMYILYIDNWSMNGVTFNLTWTGTAEVGCTILPVEMISFDAYPQDEHINVEWSTATEQNSAWYDVERSADGVAFENIGQVPAAGNSQSLTRYSFVDDAPLAGVSYYRLRQVDINGDHWNSNMVAVMMRTGNELVVHPNPAQDVLWMSLVLDKETRLDWTISDMSGRSVAQGSFAGVGGRNMEQIEISRLDQGSYALEVKDASGRSQGNTRFIKH